MSFTFIPVGYLSEVFMNAEILKKKKKKKSWLKCAVKELPVLILD